tara:strand:- start:740 stop:997 length:258 start_codon:yes stop_codon:yes gene_type:complete
MVKGRPTGSPNRTHYKWKLTVFDKETNTFRGGKYSTIREMNTQEGHDPPWNCDFVNRLYTGIGQEKFNKRHGHLQLEKIHEVRTH